MRKIVLIAFILANFLPRVNGQYRVVENPAIVQQSHPELKIEKISFYTDSIVVRFFILNKLSEGGWFCADRNTYIEDPDSFKRLRAIGKSCIPWCPSAHGFTEVGEKLHFSLTFPPVPGDPETLNIIEVCEKSCFELRGIILSKKLNHDLRLFDEAMRFYAENNHAKALVLFGEIVEEIPPKPTHVYGYSFYNLARICWEIGERETAKEWMRQLELSGLPNSQYFLRNLEQELVE